MPFGVIIGVGVAALLSGPILGGVRWHAWNREHVRSPIAYRHAEDEPREIEISNSEDESVTA